MRIEKRSMNWLPKPSLYQANEAARAKRRVYARNDIALQQSLAGALTSVQSSTSNEQFNLTLRIAAQRVQASARAKAGKLA